MDPETPDLAWAATRTVPATPVPAWAATTTDQETPEPAWAVTATGLVPPAVLAMAIRPQALEALEVVSQSEVQYVLPITKSYNRLHHG